ncbi:MAG: hypothetical protein JWM49_1094 [Microbacteriaceae bacterium]|nr:hypothetical protein [Microbacteriaceae bacterium]
MKIAWKLSVVLSWRPRGRQPSRSAGVRSALVRSHDRSHLTATGTQAVTESGHIVDFYTALSVGTSDIPTATAAQAATLSSVVDHPYSHKTGTAAPARGRASSGLSLVVHWEHPGLRGRGLVLG